DPHGLIARVEPAVAASEGGQHIVAGWINAQGLCGPPVGAPCKPPKRPGFIHFGFSTDAGHTWIDAGPPPALDHVFTWFDPWADRGGLDKNTFYLSTEALHDKTSDPLGLAVFRGHFAGTAFNWEDVHVLPPPSPDDLYDRDVITMAKDGSGLGFVSV